MTIRDRLIPRLQTRFPDRAFKQQPGTNIIAIFPAAHPEVGSLTIWDEETGAVVGIEHITHGHFSAYDPALKEEEVVQHVCNIVIDFLEALFSDQVLLWISNDGEGGGWRYLSLSPEVLPMPEGAKFYLWSGPIDHPPV